MEQSPIFLRIALDTPLDGFFEYRWPLDAVGGPPCIGQLVRVPFGSRDMTGMIVGISHGCELATEKIRDAMAVRTQLQPLSDAWLDLCRFAADYYHRPLGEVALPGIPKNLRSEKTVSLDRALKRLTKSEPARDVTPAGALALNEEQGAAVGEICDAEGFAPFLLHGVTGSGKTEVYLHIVAHVLARHGAGAQVLMLIPEINLTPQLEAGVRARFPGVDVVTLHSGLAEGERLENWLAAHLGRAAIVLGTRLAVLASMPDLKLIVVDEEHDPSYKQQEGLRYSARDLAVWRAHQMKIPVVLGSATPSLETWYAVKTGRYRRVGLSRRAAANATLPAVRLIDTEHEKAVDGLTPSLMKALRGRLERGEQSLLYLNRRGYAPVISCDACGWVSNCRRCTAFMVLHKPERRLRCHHCGLEQRIPVSCPTCGNIDIQPMGRGTQRIEEHLHAVFPDARIARIDADSTRRKGSAQAAFEKVHQGEVDILIGTQMVAKGHDFKNLTLVGVLNPDTALFSHDYRAAERLFAQLMQVSGRAGRGGGAAGEVLIQTRYPMHPLYAAAAAHDYERYADALLAERRQARLPPFMYQALLRAEARKLDVAMQFLQAAAELVGHEGITANDPVPMTVTRVANVERAQLLVESVSRPALQEFLASWVPAMKRIKTRARWTLEVDPLEI